MSAARPDEGGGPPHESVKLAAELRELRTATGLSLVALAAKSPYSKSSWERYLNGKVLPPRAAVETLCALAGERPERAIALWRLADAAVNRRGAAGPRPAAAPPTPAVGKAVTAPEAVSPSPSPLPSPPEQHPYRYRRRSAPLVAVLGCVLAAATAGVLFLAGDRAQDGRRTGTGTGPEAVGRTAPGPRPAPGPACHGTACTGTNPESARCATADAPPVTLAERDFGAGAVLKVRRSVVCDTVWARLDRGREGDRVEISVADGEPQRADVHDRFDAIASVSTPMVAASEGGPEGDPDQVRVCLIRAGARDCLVLP